MRPKRHIGRWAGALAIAAWAGGAGGCGAAYERAARAELAEDGYGEVTLRPLERARNAFSFEASRGGEPCRGEIEVREEVGNTVGTVTSLCGEGAR